jgi:hypothetical protein
MLHICLTEEEAEVVARGLEYARCETRGAAETATLRHRRMAHLGATKDAERARQCRNEAEVMDKIIERLAGAYPPARPRRSMSVKGF